MQIKSRFEEIKLQKQNGILDKRYSAGSILEKIPSQNLPQLVEHLVTPRKSTQLNPIAASSPSINASQLRLFSLVRPLGSKEPPQLPKKINIDREFESGNPPLRTLVENHGLKYLQKRNNEKLNSRKQMAESVALMSRLAQTQRSQLSSLLVDLKQGSNRNSDQGRTTLSIFAEDARPRMTPRLERKYSQQHSKEPRESDDELLKKEQIAALESLFYKPEDQRKKTKRRYKPPLMNLSQEEKKMVDKAKKKFFSRTERSDCLSMESKEILSKPSARKEHKNWNSLTINQLAGSSNMIINDSLQQDFSAQIERKLGRSKFAQKTNFLIDMKNLMNVDQDEVNDDFLEENGIRKFKILKKISVVDEINNLTFKKYYDIERGKTFYGEGFNKEKNELHDSDSESGENNQENVPDYELFSSKVNTLIRKLDKFMVQGFGVRDVITMSEELPEEMPKVDQSRKRKFKFSRQSSMIPIRPYKELVDRMRSSVKGLISLKVSNLNFPMKEILHDLGKTQIFSNRPFEKPNSQKFIAAAKVGNRYTISALLVQSRYLVYDFDHFNLTALHWSSKRGHFEVTELLLQAGADVNAKDMLGRTPLFLAIRHNNLKVMQMLLWYQASPWSSPAMDFAKVLKDKPLATKLLKKSRKIHIIMMISPSNLKKNYWLREGQVLMVDPETNENIYFNKSHLEI